MYATKQYFGTQRASMGRPVICKPLGSIVVGTIFMIDEQRDRPVIMVFGAKDPERDLAFHATRVEEDLDKMPPGSWTWPPHLPNALQAAQSQPLREGHTLEGTPNGRFA
jgi:hypothetical protein